MRIAPEEEYPSIPFPSDVPDVEDDPQAAAEWLSDYVMPWLSKAELEFCSDLAGWRGWPTERQMVWLEAIASGIVHELACMHAPPRPHTCPRCGQTLKGARLTVVEGGAR